MDSNNDLDQDFNSIDAELLTSNSKTLRRKFLDYVYELLTHTKRGNFVTATALREKENEVKVEIAQNNGLNAKDRTYLDLLKQFLALQANGKANLSK